MQLLFKSNKHKLSIIVTAKKRKEREKKKTYFEVVIYHTESWCYWVLLLILQTGHFAISLNAALPLWLPALPGLSSYCGGDVADDCGRILCIS